MYFRNERMTLFQRGCRYSALVLFFVLSSAAALKLAGRWICQNPYLLLLAGVFVVSLATALIAAAPRWFFVAARLRLSAFALTVTAALVFVFLSPLPITSVVIGVRRVPRSMEFFLQHHDHDHRGQWRSVYKTRGEEHARVSFVLPQPIRGRDTGLRIYMGRNPHRIHFGRFPGAVEVERVSYGTDFFHWPLPLAVYEDESLLAAAGVVAVPQRTALVDHAVEALKMEIMWDEDRVRRDSGPARVMLIKLLWVALASGMAAMIVWSSLWLPRLRPIWEASVRYLVRTADP